MNNHKILKIFVIGILLLFLVHQIYSAVYKPITTESAEFYEAIDGVKFNGLIVREETVIESGSTGVLHFVASDGSRVAKGGAIADIYDSASTSYTVSRISELNGKIADIEELQAYNSVSASDLSLVNAKVDEALGELVKNCTNGTFTDSSEYTRRLLTAVNRRQMITGEQTDFSARLTALKEELSTLSASLPAASGIIAAPMSGYFISHVDGYEGMLSGKTPEELTPEFLKTVKVSEISEKAVGKIVSGYEWLVAGKISVNDSTRFKEGDELYLHSAAGGGSDLPVTVKAINLSNAEDAAVIVLSCGSVSRELASVRYANFTLVNNTYSGLKIQKKALRIVNGTAGVYVLNGSAVKFVPVNVLYTMDDYIICEQESSNEEKVLRLYDEVVVKGKKLYDGKVVG